MVSCGHKTTTTKMRTADPENICAHFSISTIDNELFEVTSLIIICCYELMIVGKFVSIIWRIFFDNQLSIILSKLEKIHEKLIRLNMVEMIEIKMNWFFIIGIIVHILSSIITPLLWLYISIKNAEMINMVNWIWLTACECGSFYEYILLILYIQRMVYMINENIPERNTCLSTFRDMYLEVLECLNHINRSIYGLPVIVAFIFGNICDIIKWTYNHLLFPRTYINDQYYFLLASIELLLKIANVIILYGVGHVTEKEINRMTLVLHQRSVIERNPRIKRQIKIFILRRFHEYYRFELYGICQINLRKLLILINKTIAYLIIQIMFKLNK
ncbi:uncharacterized protein LOC132926717 [Rhopalosiphum padi]|uniref:uncharacterized protein LOC132926717 n=1 Tax=Rhopalosiphum padi TaxID=40932 RepID=UPI00298DDDAB|nr:uncharacterized protein LOC132926717 [Rhopalosiphum padi]